MLYCGCLVHCYISVVFTLYRRLRVLRSSPWWQHSWLRSCTCLLSNSWTVFWLHPREKPPLLRRSLHQRQRWSGTAGCLKEEQEPSHILPQYLVFRCLRNWNNICRFCSNLFAFSPHLSLGHTSGWVLWLSHRSPALHSLQWHYGWCWA